MLERNARSCHSSRNCQASSPIASTSDVEPTMSVNMNARLVREVEAAGARIARRCAASSPAPSRSYIARAASRSVRAPDVSPATLERGRERRVRAGGLVRGVDLRPSRDASPELHDGLVEIVFEQRGLAPRDREARDHRRRRVRDGELVELGHEAAREVELADRRRDGDRGRQQEGSRLPHERALVARRALDGAQRALAVTLVELQERGTRLRIEAVLGGAAECVARAVAVTAPAAHLTELVERPPRVARRGRHQLVDRVEGVALGELEVAAQPHDLGAVELAQTGEPGHVLALRPAERGVGPRRRALPVAHVAAGEDRAAVDLAGREQLDVAAHGDGCAAVDLLEAHARPRPG